MNRKIVILHPALGGDASPDDRDTLTQRDDIAAALGRLGYDAVPLAVTLDLEAARRALEKMKPRRVFNLVESLGGMDRLLFLAPALLDAMGISYTGCSAEAIFRTTGKLSAKRDMRRAGLPTPAFMEPGSGAPEPGSYIVKSSWDHSSIGIDDTSIITLERGDDRWHGGFRDRFSSEFFAERFIDGREFNISLLDGPGGAEILPPAEMLFTDYPEGKMKIVDYRAKWDTGAFEYHHTVRSFDFGNADAPLLEKLRRLSADCRDLFGLKGYARVDFRVDGGGNPWILEINANPCLASDAGFMAAAERAGLGFDDVIRRIVEFE